MFDMIRTRHFFRFGFRQGGRHGSEILDRRYRRAGRGHPFQAPMEDARSDGLDTRPVAALGVAGIFGRAGFDNRHHLAGIQCLDLVGDFPIRCFPAFEYFALLAGLAGFLHGEGLARAFARFRRWAGRGDRLLRPGQAGPGEGGNEGPFPDRSDHRTVSFLRTFSSTAARRPNGLPCPLLSATADGCMKQNLPTFWVVATREEEDG
jgi:hypothetical protein